MTFDSHLAELVLFSVFAIPAIYCLVRQPRSGLLGWLFLFLFCVIRIVSSVFGLLDETSEETLIIGNVGLSPLFLACLGIVHEARALRNPGLNAKLERIVVLIFHLIIAAGIALLAVGLSGLYDPDSGLNSDRTLIRAGISVLTAVWALLVLYCVSAFVTGRHYAGEGSRAGLILASATTFALAWLGVRVVYTLVAFVTEKPRLSPVNGDLVYFVVLVLLPEILATVALLVAGVVTVSAAREVAQSQRKHRDSSRIKSSYNTEP